MSNQSTILQLLTRDGAVTATFTPSLTSEQYDLLLKEVDTGDTRQKLAELLQTLARSWHCQVMVD